MKHSMKRAKQAIAFLLAIAVLPVAPAVASEQDDVMKVVHQWVDGWNEGDAARAVAACAKETTIVDEYPPYHWQGDSACSRWMDELVIYNKSIGLTPGLNKLRKPRRVDVTGEHAYVVVPADYTYTLNGKKGAEIGALFTVALRKEQAGWRITGWAWSRP